MSGVNSTAAHGLLHHTQAVCFAAANNFYPTTISLPPPSDWDNVLLEGECEVFDQHPDQTFHGSPVPSTTGTSGTQVQNDPQTGTYFGADQMNLDLQMGGLSGCQTSINSHPRVRSSEADTYATDLPPRTGGVHASLFGHMNPMIHDGRDISYQLSACHPAPQTPQGIPDVSSHTTPSMGAHACLSNWQTTALPGPTTHMPDSQISSSTSVLSPRPSLPAFEGASPTVASSPVLKGKGPKKILPATAFCPFPHCSRKYKRSQELKRHMLGHLPDWICCTQSGCDWTGYRRDLLLGHLRKEHQDVPFLEYGSEGSEIYDAKRLAKQLLKKKITVEQAEREAHAAFRKRGV